MHRLAVIVVGLVAACGDDGMPPPPEMVGGCNGIATHLIPDAGIHMPIGTAIEWSTNPPSSGAHYPIWAGWDRHYQQLDRGYYVHNLEHGGVVLLYNCPDGCQDIVDSLIGVVRDAADDPTCEGAVHSRLVVAADPLMPPDVKVAAVAWGELYTAECFDPYVTQFIRFHYRHGTEDICSDGAPMSGSLIVSPP